MDHPVFEIPTALAGRLYAMPCPAPRRLSETFATLSDQGVTTVLSMLPSEEADALGVGEAPAICASLGIAHRSFPIRDFGLPQAGSFHELIEELLTMLKDGESIAVHCRAGIGRTGLAVVAVLIASGMAAEQALESVSAARGVSVPDTAEQRDFLKAFDFSLRHKPK